MKYLNSLRNQLLAARAWMFATLFFAIVCAYLLFQVSQLVSGMPTRLVPYEFAVQEGPMEVDGRGRSSPEYLTQIAIADVSLYADWTPRTVEAQTSRFLNRLAPSLFSSVRGRLLNRADNASDAEYSQSFFLQNSSVSEDDNLVKLEGEIESWSGSDQETYDVTYTINYTFNGGVPYVTDFESASPEN